VARPHPSSAARPHRRRALSEQAITYWYHGHSGSKGFLSVELWDADHRPLPDDLVSEDLMLDFADFLALLLSSG
jgi:hypothetical protein